VPNKKKLIKKSGFSLKNLSIIDWLVILFFAALLFVPDPIDFLTAGLPVLEGIIVVMVTVIESRSR
jgi:hypothetical protein